MLAREGRRSPAQGSGTSRPYVGEQPIDFLPPVGVAEPCTHGLLFQTCDLAQKAWDIRIVTYFGDRVVADRSSEHAHRIGDAAARFNGARPEG